jgi:hypothetical protein
MRLGAVFVVSLAGMAVAFGQFRESAPDAKHPAIQYSNSELQDPVAELNRKLAGGAVQLKFDQKLGYLPALAEALKIPVESQIMVFSKTSLQSILISPSNPRAILFNDSAAIAFVRGSPTLEVTAQDPRAGTIFYTLDQSLQSTPVLTREDVCLGCHKTPSSLDVPGLVVRTVFPHATGALVKELSGAESDDRTAFEDRWGGWYATGRRGPLRHRANVIVASVDSTSQAQVTRAPNSAPLQEKFATTGYLTPYSDIVALTVFEHQTHMTNLITRIGWEARSLLSQDPAGRSEATTRILRAAAKVVVDYLLFIDEAQWTGPMEGTSGFAARFASSGPFDSKRRSLRELDLKARLMRYPCSYMIYSESFQALPPIARNAIYLRLWNILSGQEKDRRYARLSAADRIAIVEILTDTVKDLPDYFKPARPVE